MSAGDWGGIITVAMMILIVFAIFGMVSSAEKKKRRDCHHIRGRELRSVTTVHSIYECKICGAEFQYRNDD